MKCAKNHQFGVGLLTEAIHPPNYRNRLLCSDTLAGRPPPERTLTRIPVPTVEAVRSNRVSRTARHMYQNPPDRTGEHCAMVATLRTDLLAAFCPSSAICTDRISNAFLLVRDQLVKNSATVNTVMP